MKRRVFLWQAGYGVVGVGATAMTGCGTILHPERQGCRHSGRLDMTIVLLDACGLILWFVPGIIAFCVDFYTGAIFIPCGYYCENGSKNPQEGVAKDLKLKKIEIPKDQLDQKKLEQVISEQIGESISLHEDDSRFSMLTSLDEFPAKHQAHLDDPRFGHSYALLADNARGMI